MRSPMISIRPQLIRILLVILGIGGLVTVGVQAPSAATQWQTVTYRGEHFRAPDSWPVVDLAAGSTACPRMDRHAVYLGRNADVSACPAGGVGVTDAVQVEPLDAAEPSLASSTVAGQRAQVNSADQQAVSHRLVAAFPRAGVLVTISFGADPALARKILASFAASGQAASAAPEMPASPAAGTATTSSVLFSGKGFDTCGAPSEATMSAWFGASPYRAVGVYIGGANRACPDGNLSASWVQDEVAAGWNLIPLYVGLQPSCTSGFQRIDPAQAAGQGTAAADDAVSRASFFGIGAGSPIYYDMEAWNTEDKTCSAGVVAFVRAWTAELVKKGYRSGIYGSAGSGIGQAIAPLYGQSNAPGLVDFAQWNGVAGTSTTYFPATDWPDHRRIKQYDGNVTESWGGVQLNIDRDFADGVLAGNPQPAVSGISPAAGAAGTRVRITGRAFVPGATTVKFGGVASGAVTVSGGGQLVAAAPSRSITAVDVTVTTPAGTSVVATSGRFSYRPLIAATTDPKTGGYWLSTPQGNVYNFGAPFHGSAATKSLPAPVVGTAADPKSGGYWLVTSKGNVYNFGAPFHGSAATKSLPAPVVGMAADPKSGGYWLVTSKGNVYNFGAPFHGSAATKSLPAPVAAVFGSGAGYVLTTSAGNVFNYNAPWYGSPASPK